MIKHDVTYISWVYHFHEGTVIADDCGAWARFLQFLRVLWVSSQEFSRQNRGGRPDLQPMITVPITGGYQREETLVTGQDIVINKVKKVGIVPWRAPDFQA